MIFRTSSAAREPRSCFRGPSLVPQTTVFLLCRASDFQQRCRDPCHGTLEAKEIARLRLQTRVFVVPNAVAISTDTDVTDLEVIHKFRPGLQPEQKLILFLGRCVWIKNLEALLDAFIQLQSDFPQWQLMIAGTHEELSLVKRLRHQISVHRLESRVTLTGTVLKNEGAALYRRAEIFVLPSWHENFGVSVVEALHYGVPCLLSNRVALAAEVVQGGAGIACEPSASALAQQLRRLMLDDSLRLRLSQNAPRIAMRFDPNRIASEMDAEYKLCISGQVAKNT